MALIQDLIKQIDDQALRDRIMTEVDKLSKQKKFGLVFEEHLPECTPLYDVKIRQDSKVALKTGQVSDIYIVRSINGDKAICEHRIDHAEEEFALNDLVAVAEFGEPIYPYLKPIDTVCNAPDSDLWHTLIEADNYHALQLLEYLYAGKVDCIYIDPPYNTGAKDWKYNNNYVDSADTYRHSKWLSMMKKRLIIAKKLLNPADSVLIVTIDEKEYLHLGCLLEELFPEARIQMVSSLISPQGNQRKNQFSRLDEYLFFIEFGNSAVQKLALTDDWRINADDTRTTHLHWQQLIRNGNNGTRRRSPNCFYPIYVSEDGKHFVGAGDPLPIGEPRDNVHIPDGVIPVWPIHKKDGSEGCWALSKDNLIAAQKKGYVKLGKLQADKSIYITYLQDGMVAKVENGDFEIEGYAEDGSIISNSEVRSFIPGTQWRIPSHDASRHGNQLLKDIFGEKRFDFPKSLYATHDAISFFVANKPNALIVDFFAGSGTTLHAINLLNAEDGGKRRCILVTNNEVYIKEAETLAKNGYKPGDCEWERFGIAHYIAWPRTVCSINGKDIKGENLKGNYIGSDIPMADGFKANAVFFKLGFLDKASVRIGMQFREMLPTLWMKAGCFGLCPIIKGQKIPEYMILPENRMAILNDNSCFAKFAEEVGNAQEIETVYLVTDSDADYRSMSRGLNVKQTYQLYRDYLDNFRINSRR